jgi:hypothetical protein
MSELKKLSDAASIGLWEVVDNHGAKFDASRFENGAFTIEAPEDCEDHSIADFSCNHTCRFDADCEANADFVVALVNAYREGRLVENDTPKSKEGS